ncbi:hypothetical protein BT69DRAFT_1349869, partial [Atractiella rhizophila]
MTLQLFFTFLLVSTANAQTTQQPNPCVRWGQQTARINNTLYVYGGQARLEPGQQSGTWTNAFLSLPLDSSFSTGSPPLKQISLGNANPPAVSLGSLFCGPEGSLLQYGGEFSDQPYVQPTQAPIWRWDESGGWRTQTLNGDGELVRIAEGAGAQMENGGNAYYFGGHMDYNSVYGWSIDTQRVYTGGLVEFDFQAGTYQNLSTGSSSDPVYRADHTLTWVPSDGKGLLVSLGGGNDHLIITNDVLDVYNLDTNEWGKQPTTGDTLPPRTNHCAVLGKSGDKNFQIFVYGGQNANQTARYSDVYILDIPSYKWTYVGDNLPGHPGVRVGHTCELVGREMLVVGGLVEQDLMCDQPGIYVYDVTASSWKTTFDGKTDYKYPENPSKCGW